MVKKLAVLVVFGIASLMWSSPAQAQDLFDCNDFQYQEEAQFEFNKNTSDPYDLDRDNDGKACETLPSVGDLSVGAECFEEGLIVGDLECVNIFDSNGVDEGLHWAIITDNDSNEVLVPSAQNENNLPLTGSKLPLLAGSGIVFVVAGGVLSAIYYVTRARKLNNLSN